MFEWMCLFLSLFRMGFEYSFQSLSLFETKSLFPSQSDWEFEFLLVFDWRCRFLFLSDWGFECSSPS
jgi:hypothetical protein